MPTLCVVEVTQLRTKAVETKAMPLLRQWNTGRTCLPLPITTRENTSLAVHVVQKNHNNTSEENRKTRGLKFNTLYWRHLAA